MKHTEGMSTDPAEHLRQLLQERPDLAQLLVEELRAMGYTIEDLPPTVDVPFVAIGAHEAPPWINEPLTCPECGAGPLPLHDSEHVSGDDTGIKLRYISHCGRSWMRGPIT